ncbi:MAG: MFS transporter [Bacteroidetes bacterium]|jgi:OPA family glycerol-3-phosphate transporter-like MFS transporter|nr:MFS transporter [Bacteroidota bacterium]
MKADRLAPAGLLRFTGWHMLTTSLLLLGYMGYYICRSNWAVVTPLLLKEYALMGLTMAHIQWISSFGLGMYMLGKVVNGILGDFIGGKLMFVLGMVLSVVATLYMGLALGFGTLFIGWGANRLAQSMGWAALVKSVARWFNYWHYGQIMGILSLSYLFGDSLARIFLGYLIEDGFGWRGIFYFSAAVLSTVALITWWMLPGSPEQKKLPPARINPQNLFGEAGDKPQAYGMLRLIKPFFSHHAFWLVALMSFGLTGARELINQWSVLYLEEISGMAAGMAARYSAIFSFVGGISALIFGFGTDRWARGKRGALILGSMVLLLLISLAFYAAGQRSSLWASLVGLGVVGFLLIGPYTFLAGAIALDLGAKKASATAVGLIDGAGYLGALSSGIVAAYLLRQYTWNALFLLIALLCSLTALAAFLYWRSYERASKPAAAGGATGE